jgi:hypothetical protein
VFSAFFDASENGGHFSVGGLLFRKGHIRKFEREWKKMLRKFEIPYSTLPNVMWRKVFFHIFLSKIVLSVSP